MHITDPLLLYFVVSD